MTFSRSLPEPSSTPSYFHEELSSEQFAVLGSVHLLAFSARACSLAFLSSGYPFLAIRRAVFIYLVLLLLFFGLFLGLSLFSDSVCFSYSECSFFFFSFSQEFFMRLLRAFHRSGSVLSSRAALSSENACS